jgi:hypothetical protein
LVGFYLAPPTFHVSTTELSSRAGKISHPQTRLGSTAHVSAKHKKTKRNREYCDIWKGESGYWRDLQSKDPSERNLEGRNDDEIRFHVEPDERSDHHARGHVELVVPRRPHVQHRRVRISTVRCSLLGRRRFEYSKHQQQKRQEPTDFSLLFPPRHSSIAGKKKISSECGGGPRSPTTPSARAFRRTKRCVGELLLFVGFSRERKREREREREREGVSEFGQGKEKRRLLFIKEIAGTGTATAYNFIYIYIYIFP